MLFVHPFLFIYCFEIY